MENILVTGLLGIASSLVAELVTWINKKLSGTVMKGNGAFIVALLIALVGGGIKVLLDGFKITDWSTFGTYFAQVFAISQIWFYLIAQKLGLQVK
jgi:hypothetical protein